VTLNCAAVSENLLESELFGHVRGAFSGAVRDRPGRFEQAHGGTLFLDEVGEIPLEMQSKLLRVLQEGQFERVGSAKTHQVDVRIIAATNRDLGAALRDGSLREDLYYRINVIEIHLEPLRDRREDIEPLAEHYRERFVRELGRNCTEFSSAAISLMKAHPWPGNVRELRNAIEAATVKARGATILPDHLPDSTRATGTATDYDVGRLVAKIADSSRPGMKYESVHDAFEKALVGHVLGLAGNNQVQAAKQLGIHRTTLRKLIEKYAG